MKIHLTSPNRSPATAAVRLAARGWAVVPFDARTKRPACRHGVDDATTDEATIRAWFARPNLIPAIATGEASGIDVLDLDLAKHPEAAGWLSDHAALLPETACYETRSGGRHYWFRHHPGLRCSTARPLPGIDVRADRGCAIVWPVAGKPIISRAPIAEWPAWLLDTIAPPPAPPRLPAPPPRVPDDRQLAALIRVAATAPESRRNAALYWAARRMAPLVASRLLSDGEAVAILVEAASRNGLPEREARATARSGLRTGRAS